MKKNRVTLDNVCISESSNLAQKDIMEIDGDYPVFGASGYIKSINFYKQEKEYVAVIKDGAGVGRTMYLPAKSSVIGTLQYLLPKENIESKYLYYAITSMKLGSNYTGATIPHIYFKDYKHKTLPLPSKEEQNRIIRVLEQVEGMIKKRKNQLEEYDNLTKSRFVEMFGDPETNTKKYRMVNLCDIAQYFNGLTYSPENVSDEGIIVLRSSNIQNSKLDFKDIVRVRLNVKENKIVRENDILMCSRNGSAKLVGKVALIDNLPERMAFGAFMMIIRSEYYVYLFNYFQMDAFRRQITTGATTTINQITSSMLDKVKLPLPEKCQVNEFEIFVKQVNKLKSCVYQSLNETQQLFDSLMQEYFG